MKKGYVYTHVDVCLIISSTRVHSLAKMTLDICDTKFEVWVEEIQTGGSRGKGGACKRQGQSAMETWMQVKMENVNGERERLSSHH